MKIFNIIYIVNKSDVFEKMTLKKKNIKDFNIMNSNDINFT